MFLLQQCHTRTDPARVTCQFRYLECMQSLNVISKVDQPTPWCAGMVVIPKKNSKVHICVDLKVLNENLLRETHPLPQVDKILAQLNGATIFSKGDANSSFWQIPFTEQSRLLTTFITPFGHYCAIWNH